MSEVSSCSPGGSLGRVTAYTTMSVSAKNVAHDGGTAAGSGQTETMRYERARRIVSSMRATNKEITERRSCAAVPFLASALFARLLEGGSGSATAVHSACNCCNPRSSFFGSHFSAAKQESRRECANACMPAVARMTYQIACARVASARRHPARCRSVVRATPSAASTMSDQG